MTEVTSTMRQRDMVWPMIRGNPMLAKRAGIHLADAVLQLVEIT